MRPTAAVSTVAAAEDAVVLLPTISAAAMCEVLAVCARDEGIDAMHRAMVVWNGAGGHTSGDLAVPPYSPERQPAERLWPLVNEAVANRAVADLHALMEVLVDRCRALRVDRTNVRAVTCFHWWPSDATLAILY